MYVTPQCHNAECLITPIVSDYTYGSSVQRWCLADASKSLQTSQTTSMLKDGGSEVREISTIQ